MHLQRSPLSPHAPHHAPLSRNRRPHTHAHGHSGHDAQARGDREAFKVFGFARCVFGEGGDGDVEAGEAGEPAEDEEGEEEGVEGGAEAEGEGAGGGGDAKGDLGWGLLDLFELGGSWEGVAVG